MQGSVNISLPDADGALIGGTVSVYANGDEVVRFVCVDKKDGHNQWVLMMVMQTPLLREVHSK